MPPSSEIHPLKVILKAKGKSIGALADELGMKRSTLYSRLSGQRPGNRSSGPPAWTPVPVLVQRAAEDLDVGVVQLTEWLCGSVAPPADGGEA